jgi:hypothetical protein
MVISNVKSLFVVIRIDNSIYLFYALCDVGKSRVLILFVLIFGNIWLFLHNQSLVRIERKLFNGWCDTARKKNKSKENIEKFNVE